MHFDPASFIWLCIGLGAGVWAMSLLYLHRAIYSESPWSLRKRWHRVAACGWAVTLLACAIAFAVAIEKGEALLVLLPISLPIAYLLTVLTVHVIAWIKRGELA